MGQSGWRLPDELLKRVRVRCAEEGVRQNAWVERALEKTLAGESLGPGEDSHSSPRPASPRTPKTTPVERAALENIRESLGMAASARDVELSEGGGCPDCGGEWTRKTGVPGRFCVDCGAMEAK